MAPVYGESKRCALVPEGSGSSGGTAATSESAVYRRALGETFRRFHAGLVRMLSVRTGSVEDAKEIMQEAYARIIALDHPGAIGVLPGYLWQTAVNLATDRKRHTALLKKFCRSTRALAAEWALSAEETAESRERLLILERALDRLPPRCLEAFVLHVLKGLTFDEVGREMRISTRMAQKHLARALEYVQSCIDAADETESSR